MAVIAAAATLTVVGGLASANQADKAAGRASRNRNNAQTTLDATKAARAVVPNPYANIKDLSSMAADLSGMISNPYANIGVATQAAQMQIEEADIALANTLDTLRATGASAGGATALAQAALKSKQGVSSSIEQQEAANEKLKAQGEANLQNIKMSEAQRVQGALMGEQGRLQQADVAGEEFMYRERDARDMQKLNRKQAQITGAQQQQAAANQAQAGYIGVGISAVGNFGTSLMGMPGK